ncbi:glycoside hydrolase family 27 protein [Amycolatopsis sp. K13G38]|uniref:Alpha-galactosidase n=1 Tax=Amycolatopsis acididurans TaxID=2724524 RepID=A0ABX1J9P1_9PSEU|nr:glycoside hydrolase family 27 protein [Amycolatopsis acididurans]NKQ56505.1 glycoside hydrolase family 27 protein [Amycolatopsis acididurans]
MLGRIVLAAVTLAASLIWPSGPGDDLHNGLAATPPMGWNSWNQVGCDGLNEQVVRDAADTLVRTGMRDAGYRYVVVDDCWQDLTRAADGSLRPDPERFPHGIAALADYVHSRGLLFGIYAVPGSGTCAMYNSGYPATGIGSLGHEGQDARTFAAWGVDFLKYDWCYADTHDGLDERTAFAKMRDELQRTGRPILYSISEYGVQQPWNWGRGVANMWRTTYDLTPDWNSVTATIEQQAEVATGSPGAWNDPDMLQIGNGTLTPEEDRAHFSMWAVLNAPLFVGTAPSADDLATLENPEVIAVDQDFAGTQGRRLSTNGALDVWGKPLSGGGYAVVLLNRGDTPATMSADIAGRWRVRDLWLHKDVPSARATVPAHGAVMLRLTPA